MTQAPPEPPTPLYGFLQPGEKATRVFSAELDADHAAVLQRIPHSGVRIAEQSSTDIVLENAGEGVSPYIVFFPSRSFVKTVVAGKEVVGGILELVRNAKRKK
jgi:hypothetical protein